MLSWRSRAWVSWQMTSTVLVAASLLTACAGKKRDFSDPETVHALVDAVGAAPLLPNAQVGGASDSGSSVAETPRAPDVAVPDVLVPADESISRDPTPGGSADDGPPAVTPTLPEQTPVPPAVAVELSAAGSGTFGHVRSTPPGLDCSAAPCRATFPFGSTVTLEAFTEPSAGDGFAGWSGACSGLEVCSLTLTADLAVSARYEPANRVFVTSTPSDGNLGGITSADVLCTSLASPVGISGEVRAWLSTSSVDAIERLQGSRGWVRMDGKAVVDTPEDLQGGKLFHPIRIDEQGRDIGSSTLAFTGTDANGENCQDWTSNAGIPGAFGNPGWVGTGFTSAGSLGCNRAELRIYCFEVGKVVRVSPAPVAGRVAFVGTVSVDGGLAAADAQCQAQAWPFNGVGTFKAVLASAGASAASRFNLAGAPWVRADGVPIAATAAAFFQAERWDSSPNLLALGQVTDNAVMAGGSSLLAPGTSENTCANWTSTSSTGMVQGRSQASDPFGYFYGSEVAATTCAQRVYGVLCLQE